MDEKITDVLDAIFNSTTGYGIIERNALAESPNYSSVFGFAELLSNYPHEEAIQKFILSNPKFLTALEGFGDSQVLALIPKPRIGQKYYADYCLLMYSQGGCIINLIELEPATVKLFTKKLGPAKRYQDAITQVTDWKAWITINQTTFINEIIDRAKNLKLFKETKETGFRTVSPTIIKKTWDSFGGFTDPAFIYTIIIGRWSSLNETERSRLISLNNSNWYKTFTYEQMIRRGIERPFGSW